MAEEKFHEIREEAFAKFDLTCMHIYHSMGKVKAGEICLLYLYLLNIGPWLLMPADILWKKLKQMFQSGEKNYLKMTHMFGKENLM